MERDIISGDGHIDLPWLPADLFVSNAPARLKDRMPQVKNTPEGMQWHMQGRPIAPVAAAVPDSTWGAYVPGQSRRLDRMEELGFFSDGQRGVLRPTTPSLRVKDQDLDGVCGEVIYGILGVAGWAVSEEAQRTTAGASATSGNNGMDADLVSLIYEIYNEWAAEFCKTAASRFAGLACLSGRDPKAASKQLRRAAEIGLKGAELNVSTAVEPIYHQDWDVLWATAAECGMPISFHTLGLSQRQPKESDKNEYRWVSDGLSYTLFQLSGAEYLSSIVFSGACDRYPGFQFVLGECGIGWIPYILQRMDQEYETQAYQIGLSLKPSEYWRRQGYSTFQNEFLTEELVRQVGEDNIIWGSDYPHPDGIWPDSRKVIQRNLGHLDRGIVDKIVYRNSAKLYKFPHREAS